ncbi:bile acid:sodium symporter family protein [Puia sp. P3]|uniref:bile acid:sodium symporter family protein n=1 Tax=Puia sp. P3 TaxID=3423952 RepID=UPI003D671AB9
MAFFVVVALLFRRSKLLKGFSFTVIIFAAVSLAMYYPQYFIKVGDFKLSRLILPLLQVIMFGMGTELSLKEFRDVLRMPKGIFIGVVCHYTIMPLVSFSLIHAFSFPPEIAAGVVLVGCCPSGLASNVMSFLARANLALSVSVTTVSTLVAPFLTPLLMRLLAGQLVEVHFWAMVWDITQIVILPIVAGLLFNYLLKGRIGWLDRAMPLVSMTGIAAIIVVITAAGRDSLLEVGLLLIAATLLQNVARLHSGVLVGESAGDGREGLPDDLAGGGDAEWGACFGDCAGDGEAGDGGSRSSGIWSDDEYYGFVARYLVAPEGAEGDCSGSAGGETKKKLS